MLTDVVCGVGVAVYQQQWEVDILRLLLVEYDDLWVHLPAWWWVLDSTTLQIYSVVAWKPT